MQLGVADGMGGALFWFDTNNTASLPSGGTQPAGLVGGNILAFFSLSAPATAGTYYAKYAIYSGTPGSSTLLGVVVSSPITVS
jgi:hypothetical protein